MMPSKITFTSFDIKRKLGIGIDRLKDWMTRGYIEPSIQKASGQGTKNIFSLLDLYLIKLFEHLVAVRGFSRENAKSVIYDIKNIEDIKETSDRLLYRHLPQYVAFTAERQVSIGFHSLEQIPKMFENFEGIDILIINFWAIRKMVDNAIEG